MADSERAEEDRLKREAEEKARYEWTYNNHHLLSTFQIPGVFRSPKYEDSILNTLNIISTTSYTKTIHFVIFWFPAIRSRVVTSRNICVH